MEIKLWINDKLFQDDVDADMLLIDYVREHTKATGRGKGLASSMVP